MIAGNHDSATRLSFASGLLKQEGLYIEAFVQDEMKPVVIDGVNFYLLPFLNHHIFVIYIMMKALLLIKMHLQLI